MSPAGGGSSVSLAGLTPDQFDKMMGAEAEKEKLWEGKVGKLLDIPYREAATELMRGRLEELRKPEEVDEWKTLPPDEFDRIFREHKTTGKRELVAGAPPRGPAPTRGIVVPGVDPTTGKEGIYLLDPVTGTKKHTGLVPAEAGDKTAVNIPFWVNGGRDDIRVSGKDYNAMKKVLRESGAVFEKPPGVERLYEERDTLLSFTHDSIKEGGKPLKPGEEDAAGIAAFDEDLRKEGRKVMGLALPKVTRDLALDFGWPWGGDWITFKDLPARNVYMIVEEGVKELSKERVMEELMSTYLLSEDHAKLYYEAWKRGK